MFRATYEPQNKFTSPQHVFLNTKGKKISSTVPLKYYAYSPVYLSHSFSLLFEICQTNNKYRGNLSRIFYCSPET